MLVAKVRMSGFNLNSSLIKVPRVKCKDLSLAFSVVDNTRWQLTFLIPLDTWVRRVAYQWISWLLDAIGICCTRIGLHFNLLSFGYCVDFVYRFLTNASIDAHADRYENSCANNSNEHIEPRTN